jgi:thiol:disulfide interchange protein
MFIFSLFFINLSYAQLLVPQEAFKFQAVKVRDGIEVNFKIARGHLLYKEKFEFFIDDANTKVGTPVFPPAKTKFDANFNKNVEYYQKQVKIFLPLLKSKDPFTLKVIAQGCAESGICYPPSPYYYHVLPFTQSNIIQYNPAEQRYSNPRNSQGYGHAFSFMKNKEYKSAGLETVQLNSINQNNFNNQDNVDNSNLQNHSNRKDGKQEPQQDHSRFYWLFIFMCIICTAIISHPSFNKEE